MRSVVSYRYDVYVKEKISFEDLEITVQKADQRKIDKVLITRRALPNPPNEEQDEQS